MNADVVRPCSGQEVAPPEKHERGRPADRCDDRERPDARPVGHAGVDQRANAGVPERRQAAEPGEARLDLGNDVEEVHRDQDSRRDRRRGPTAERDDGDERGHACHGAPEEPHHATGSQEPAAVEPGSHERSHRQDPEDGDERERAKDQELARDRRGEIASTGQRGGEADVGPAALGVCAGRPRRQDDGGGGGHDRPEHARDVRREEDARIGQAAGHPEGRHELLREELHVVLDRRRVGVSRIG